MRDSRQFMDGTAALALPGLATHRPAARALRPVKEDVYARLARRRRKAQMAARRALGVHDDVRRAI